MGVVLQRAWFCNGRGFHSVRSRVASSIQTAQRKYSRMESSLRERLAAAGQDHVLRYWEELERSQREAFIKQLSSLDLTTLRQDFECFTAPHDDWGPSRSPVDLEPPLENLLGSVSSSDPECVQSWRQRGLLQIATGAVAVLLLAGGQGTRLGVPYPKGMYKLGLPSGKSLYQLQAEQILHLQHLTDKLHNTTCQVPWYIMTSHHTKEPTREFFAQHNYFGLRPDNVLLFEQGMLPALTFDGKLILKDKGELAMAPDGNGGLYKALDTSGVLQDMEKRGICNVHVYCVDNVLVRVADPVFIGFCIATGADCGAKVVEKVLPNESVGVVCRVGGRNQVREYSELSPEDTTRRDPDGRLTFRAANICNHLFHIDFLKRVVTEHLAKLPYHVAKKKVPYIDDVGKLVKPNQPNAVKLEKFVFDVFPLSEQFVVLEVIRQDEFAPLKNADGAATDTPSTACRLLLSLHQRWLENAGAILRPMRSQSDTMLADPVIQCEVSSLVSYAGEGLSELVNGRELVSPFVLEPSDVCVAPK
uniref:UDP-N-acetylglucosamine diphosphorylase n=1 Tax=Eptatretus burgeri TaxID=7764 RepID=A0A8C4PXU4_EPTBU